MGVLVMTAGGGHAWEPAVVAAIDAAGGSMTVTRRCADVADLLATAATGQAHACVVAADMRRLDTESVGTLHAHGVVVIAVCPAGGTDVAARMHRIGVAHTVSDDAGPDDIVAAIRGSIRAVDGDGDRSAAPAEPGVATGGDSGEGNGRHRRSPAWTSDADADADDRDSGDDPGGEPTEPASAAPHPLLDSDTDAPTEMATEPAPGLGGPRQSTARPEPPVEDGRGQGTVIAVWGPGGAPGRTSTAMGLADQFAALGRSVLLIDADVYGGLLASAYGLLDESSGLAGVCRLATNGRLDVDQFLHVCWQLDEGFTLLTGIARADRWPEVRPSAVPVLLATARAMAEVIVVDCAALLESDEELSFDTMAPRRNGATLALVNEADEVVAVGAADPPGLERLVRGLAELDEVAGVARPWVVLNRVRSTAAPAAELGAALRRFSNVEPAAFLPEDREAWDAAWRQGARLSMAAPKSALNAEYRRLADRLCPAPVGADT